jgi:hypothetical protein
VKRRKRGQRAWPKLLPVLAVAAIGAAGFGAFRYLGGDDGLAEAASPDAGFVPDGGAPLRETVRISIQTIPPMRADVRWGGKRLGILNPKWKKDGNNRGKIQPYILERPRDSGPIDIVVTAQDYVPVHTRAYTFTDGKLHVKMTEVVAKNTLFGYRQELPDAGPEAGVAPAVASGGGADAGVGMPRPLVGPVAPGPAAPAPAPAPAPGGPAPGPPAQ